MTDWTVDTWKLLHVLSEKVKDDHFPLIKNKLFNYMKAICNNLPCPECSLHATQFLSRVRFINVNKKEELQTIFLVFHNAVNKKLGRKEQPKEILNQYKEFKLHEVLNKWFTSFNNVGKGNFTYMNDHRSRERVMKDFLDFMKSNIDRFNN